MSEHTKDIRSKYPVDEAELDRRKQVSEVHELEENIIKLVPSFKKMMDDICFECEFFLSKNTGGGIKKIATGTINGIDLSGELDNKKEDVELVKKAIENFVSKWNEVRNEKVESSYRLLRLEASSLFLKIVWSYKIRSLIQTSLSHSLDSWDTMRKRLNRLLKDFAGSRINRFEFMTFLEDIDKYPINNEDKMEIISSVRKELDKIDELLGESIFDNFKKISDILSIFQNYKTNRNEVLISVKKYIASMCRRARIYDQNEIEEATNIAIIEISGVLYRYKTDKSFINYIHRFCQGALNKYKVSKRMIKPAGQISQKRAKIYQAYNDVDSNQISSDPDFNAVAKKLKEIDPNSTLSGKEIEKYIRTEDVSRLSTGASEESDIGQDLHNLTADESLEGASIYDVSPEQLLIRDRGFETMMDMMKQLSEMDQNLITLKLHVDDNDKGLTIQEMADQVGISYDVCRRRLEKVRDTVDYFKDCIT